MLSLASSEIHQSVCASVFVPLCLTLVFWWEKEEECVLQLIKKGNTAVRLWPKRALVESIMPAASLSSEMLSQDE